MERNGQRGEGKRLESGRDGGNEEKNRKIFSEFGSFPQKPLTIMCMVVFVYVCVCVQVYLYVFLCSALISPR